MNNRPVAPPVTDEQLPAYIVEFFERRGSTAEEARMETLGLGLPQLRAAAIYCWHADLAIQEARRAEATARRYRGYQAALVALYAAAIVWTLLARDLAPGTYNIVSGALIGATLVVLFKATRPSGATK